MKKYFNHLPLHSKLIIITFLITFSIVIATGGISLYFQTKQMKEQLVSHVSGLTSLWSLTIPVEQLETILTEQDTESPHYENLYHQLNLINERDSHFFHGLILSPQLIGEEVYVIVPSKDCEIMGAEAFTSFQVPDEFKDSFVRAVRTNQSTYSPLYKDSEGRWIAAFSPILDKNEQVIGVLAVISDASIIFDFPKEILLLFSFIFIIIVLAVYGLSRAALKKVLNPVNEIVKGINEVSNGNFQVKLSVDEHSEFSLLSERFNHMTEQLRLLFDRLNLTSENLGKRGTGRERTKFEDAIGEMEHIIEKTRILKELQRAEKMNAIGQLAASVAHEIRNPMTVVKGFLQIFQSKDKLTTEEHMFVKLMIDEMNRAESIINDYLSLAKPDMDSTEKVDTANLAYKVMELMNSYAMMSSNIELKTVIEDEVFVNANTNELKQVLVNMMKNGIEAMKDGGVLTVRIYKDDHLGYIEICDTGIGMTNDELERLGTAFYSLKEKGTGMGLLVCYQIIERLNGQIDVTSEIGKGTTFTISLPLYNEE